MNQQGQKLVDVSKKLGTTQTTSQPTEITIRRFTNVGQAKNEIIHMSFTCKIARSNPI